MKRLVLFLIAISVSTIPGLAQQPRPLLSPEVHADRTVTVRLRAPNAQEVLLSREGAQRIPMQKDDEGVWTVTTEALVPDYYGYSFVVDGVTTLDAANPLMKTNLLNPQNMVHVPGPPEVPWETNDVPHGMVHRHFYKSGVVGDQRDFYVYTPPGYKVDSANPYPVLYLLHGYSDGADGWTTVGQAHVILDNLIARGEAKPMLVVMPLGYGAPEVVARDARVRDRGAFERNYVKFREALLKEVIPQVEKAYSASKNRADRAIAGLSMGGSESLYTGLNELDHFAWVGAFSTGGLSDDRDKAFPGLTSKANEQLKLLWISCGVDDRLIESNRKMIEWLTSKGVKHTWTETPGAHTWMVWRRNLAQFTPLLFQKDKH